MTSINSQCNNCQILEKTILDANSSVKKLLTLKSKIIHTDALIRQFKAQKDENEQLLKENKLLLDEQDKAQNQCAKYEIDLKLALEELHSLRQSERDYKSSRLKLESEITALNESLQAEKALVKQYKNLVETESKLEDQAKDKVVKDLERKLAKKDEDIQKSRERTQRANKKLNLVSKSCLKALKFLQKLGIQTGVAENLPVCDKRTFKSLCDLLQKKNLFGAAQENCSDEEDEFLDESQYLENLLLESSPNDSCIEAEASSIMHNNNNSFDDNVSHLVDDFAQNNVHEPNSMPKLFNEKTSHLSNGTSEDFAPIFSHKEILSSNGFSPNSSCKETISDQITVVHKEANYLPKQGCESTYTYAINEANKDVDKMVVVDAVDESSSLEDKHDEEESKTNAVVCKGERNEVSVEEPMETDAIETDIVINNDVKKSEDKQDSLDLLTGSKDTLVQGTESCKLNDVAENSITHLNTGCADVSNSSLQEEIVNTSVVMESVPQIVDMSGCDNVVALDCEATNDNSKTTLDVVDGQMNTCEDQLGTDAVDEHSAACDAVNVNTSENAPLNEGQKAKVDVDCNNDSEYEEGELVIASDCETIIAAQPAEQNDHKAKPLSPDNLLNTDEEKGVVSDDKKNKADDRIEISPVNEKSLENIIEKGKETACSLDPANVEGSGVFAVPLEIAEKVNHVQRGEEEPKLVFRGSSESSLPTIPFSEDRQFQPGTSSKPAVDDSDAFNENVQSSASHHRKTKKSHNKVDKIFSRMKDALVLRCPVSPLPPSPPMTPLLKEPNGNLFEEPIGSSTNETTITELFGIDSGDEDYENQAAKSLLQHQESEGFDPETEHQEETLRRQEEFDQREVLRSIGRKVNDTEKNENNSVNHKERTNRLVAQKQVEGSFSHRDVNRNVDEHNESHNKQVSLKNRNQEQANSCLFTNFHMDPDSGRCKISIRLPDSVTSATNVRFELDTSTKEIYLDYGPSEIGSPHKQNFCANGYSKSVSPTVTLPEDTPCEPHPIRRPLTFRDSKSQSVTTDLVPTSLRKPARRTTIPPISTPLNTQVPTRRALMIGTHDKSPVDSNTQEPSTCSEVSQDSTVVFKTPAVKRRTSLAAQHRNDASDKSTPSANEMSSARNEDIPQSPLSPTPNDSNDLENNSQLDVCGKRKLEQSPPKQGSKRQALTGVPSDSTVQKHAKITSGNVEGCQVQANPKILKAFKPLQKLKLNNNNKNAALFQKLYRNFCDSSLCVSAEDLVTASLFFFSRSTLDILPQFPKKKRQLQMPLLGVKEEAFVSLLKHLQEKLTHMNNLINVFLSGACDQLSRTDKVCATGLASLCRLHTVVCRQEGYAQAAQDLCYQFVLRKHPHAAYLIANALVVWPSVLELTCSTALLVLRKKVLSLLLFATVTEENEQTARILKDVGNLESPGLNNQPDSLAKEILSLLTSKVDVSTSEDICQQLLLLSYTQGWSWTKDTVLTPLADILNNVSSSVKTPVVRLIGSFLHYCGPKAKEDSDLLVHKLQTLFKELDENDFLSKESCVHNLLPLSSQLNESVLSQMKLWLKTHRNRVSPHLQEDFINSGFLT